MKRKNPPSSDKSSDKQPKAERPKPDSKSRQDHDPRFCYDRPCRCQYPTQKLHRIRPSELHTYPAIKTSDGKTFQVDDAGLVGPARRYPISEPPTELEIELAITWFDGLAEYQINGKRQGWYGCQEVRFYLKQLHRYASQGAMAVACHRLGIPIKDDDGFAIRGLNYVLKLPLAWFRSIKLQGPTTSDS